MRGTQEERKYYFRLGTGGNIHITTHNTGAICTANNWLKRNEQSFNTLIQAENKFFPDYDSDNLDHYFDITTRLYEQRSFIILSEDPILHEKKTSKAKFYIESVPVNDNYSGNFYVYTQRLIYDEELLMDFEVRMLASWFEKKVIPVDGVLVRLNFCGNCMSSLFCDEKDETNE